MGTDDRPDLPNLLARVLDAGTHRLLRRGLDRGYVELTEETRSPKGKLRLDLMTKKQTLLRRYAVCDMDELTTDVLHNQILRASLIALADCSDVDGQLRHELKMSARRLTGVSPIRVTADLFHRVQLSRNNSQYALLMRVCELAFHSLLPDERGHGSRFQNILEDEIRMAVIFEEFLRNFYRMELPGYSAHSEIMPWIAEVADEADAAFLPVMKTDITLRSASRTLVVDAKYYSDALAGGRFAPKVRPGHLYQLVTYLCHVRARETGKGVSGLLIYPTNGRSLRLNYRLLGTQVTIATVDLSKEWQDIHAELLGLIQPD